jgi:hypothetical protein
MSDFARRYRLQERIAVGGTAEVFHALYFPGDGSERPVVIKRVLPQFARDERFRTLFLEEAYVAVTVTHPNIVKVLDHGELEQTCYIALERVEGMDLGNLLNRARTSDSLPSPSLAAFVVAQVGEALQFIHDQTSSEGTPLKIIHRDVSPQNILVSYSGDVKLTDFGIAKSAIRQETTVDGTLRGKLDYMAPEQASLGEVDRRADLFALGCVLYELLNGVPPFRGENELETLDRIREGKILKPPEELDAPAQLRQVLATALAPDREGRYQHASEMVADLRGFMAAESASVLKEDLGRWARELAATREASRPDAVEDAVRKLLGEGIGDGAAPAPSATTVFARTGAEASAPTIRREPTAEVAPAPERKLSPLSIALVVVAGLGLVGWGLWAVRYFSGGPEPVKPDARLDFLPDRHTDLPLKVDRPPDASAPRWPTLPLQTHPHGATAYLDGKSAGRTPLELRLPEKPFVLKLRKPGYRPWTKRIDPASPPSSLTVVLRPAPGRQDTGFLTINSMPWSKIYIGKTFVGNTPLKKLQFPTGLHRIELRAPDGSVRKRFTVKIRPGKTVERTFTFR